MFEQGDDSDDFKRYAKYVLPVIFGLAVFFNLYIWLKQFGWLIGVLGSAFLTLAAFAVLPWVKAWLYERRQERGPEDDGEPISLNLNSSGSRQPDTNDE